jgi:predicted nucleotidyltransferase
VDSDYTILVRCLETAFGSRLKTAVLFGSRARGEARPESDHDVFAIVEDLPADPLSRTQELRQALFAFLADLPGAMNLRARTPLEFEADLTPLYLDVAWTASACTARGISIPCEARRSPP